MSVNLDKNRDKIVAAWSDVLDDKSETNWALYGYEGQSNDLKVVGTGDGGVEELADDLNSGKIMYAFVRIEDTKTSLSKYVLINWQGEGAPVLRKGICANHIRDVTNLLKGAHMTINARNEDEIEKDRILQKVSAVGSAYSFKDHKFTEDTQKTPIGTAYSRVNPAKEINATERDKFWRKEEEEERKRVEVERDRKHHELVKTEEERRAREQKEHLEREKQIIEKKSAAPPIKIPEPLNSPITTHPPDIPETRGITQAELMRQQRNQEAKELIGSRVGTAKAIFSQNSASGQMHGKSITNAAPTKPVRNSIAQKINNFNNPQAETEIENIIKTDAIAAPVDPIQEEFVSVAAVPSPVPATNGNLNDATDNVQPLANVQPHVNVAMQQPQQHHNYDDDDDGDQFSTIKRSPHTKSASQSATPVEENVTLDTRIPGIDDTTNFMDPKWDDSPDMMIADSGLRARALYDYQAADESEITFDPGDIISHIDQIDEGWWQGLGPDGTYGLFPANYVELFKD